MTDKEKLEAIRAEIHRLVDVRGYDKEIANDLFTFMDSLPNEPVSEDLEETLKDYAYQVAYDLSNDWLEDNATWDDVETAVKLGAQWQKQQMLDKACSWLEENLPKYWSQINANNTESFIENFIQAMKE